MLFKMSGLSILTTLTTISVVCATNLIAGSVLAAELFAGSNMRLRLQDPNAFDDVGILGSVDQIGNGETETVSGYVYGDSSIGINFNTNTLLNPNPFSGRVVNDAFCQLVITANGLEVRIVAPANSILSGQMRFDPQPLAPIVVAPIVLTGTPGTSVEIFLPVPDGITVSELDLTFPTLNGISDTTRLLSTVLPEEVGNPIPFEEFTLALGGDGPVMPWPRPTAVPEPSSLLGVLTLSAIGMSLKLKRK